MRPIRLTIKGLNSFIAEQTVDFEALTKSGFFGIFGPTGSGKSTILDGMILALYGIKSMSRGTNEFVNKNCTSAKVSYEFEIHGKDVKHYRVEREFKASDCTTKSGKCRLVEYKDDKEMVLEDSVSGVDRAIVEILGLKADDFMRTVVLPQGKFSEFLKVSGKDRREILERLFHLEEYGGRLEERIASAIRIEQTERTKLSGQVEAYSDFSEEKLRESREQEKQCKEELQELKKALEQAELEWKSYEGIWALQQDVEKLEVQKEQLQQREGDIRSKKMQLEMAKKAAMVYPILQTVYRLEKQDVDLRGSLQKAQRQQMEGKEQLVQAEKAFAHWEQKRMNEEADLLLNVERGKDAVADAKQLPGLTEELGIYQRMLNDIEEKEKEALLKIEAWKSQRVQLEKDIISCEEKLQQCIVKREEREQFQQMLECAQQLKNRYEECKKQYAELTKLKSQLEAQEKEVAHLQESYQKSQEQLATLEERQKLCSENVEHIQILQIRSRLKHGEACPVCGAIHTDDRGVICEEETELDVSLLEQLELLQKELEEKKNEHAKISQQLEVNKQLLQVKKDETGEKTQQYQTQREDYMQEKEKHQQELSMLGLESVNTEYERIKKADEQRELIESKLKEYRTKHTRMVSALDTLHEQQTERQRQQQDIQSKLVPLQGMIEQIHQRMEEKLGKGIDPSTYLQQAERALKYLYSNYEQSKQQKEKAEIQVRDCESRLLQLQGSYKSTKEELEQADIQLVEGCKQQGFETRMDVEAAMLDDAHKKLYEDDVERYEKMMQETVIRLDNIRKQLNGQRIGREQYEEARRRVMVCKENEQAKNRLYIELQQEIRRLESQKEKVAELLLLLDQVEHRIAVLDDLRKVTRGKRFVEFMAIERLRYISKIASKRLFEITNGNYELEINNDGEFIIRDNKNGGVLRQPSTLSGGETFVTSLALALALSSEIQLKGTAPLELFFLDEGFGSLDDTLLDIVMESLEKIHNAHLKVGIISHVEAVKSRVPVRLVVTPADTGLHGSEVKIEY